MSTTAHTNHRSYSHEREILFNRLVMSGITMPVIAIFAYNSIILLAFAGYLAANTALYLMLRADIGRREWRWTAGILLDVTMNIATTLEAPAVMSIFYPILLWMILGNGFRFGVKFLAISSVVSTLGFGSIVLVTDYWADKQALGYSLALALLVIPAYCSKLIRKLSKAKEDAEAASNAKSYFLASVSHELRTPLNAIIGYGNHLQQQELPKGQRDMIDASVLAGEHLLHLIEQLIQVAKADSGSVVIEVKEMRPTTILTEIRNIMANRAEDKGLDLHLHAAPFSDRLISAPAETIRNILLNLVGNAIKFTENGTILVSSRIVENDTQTLLELRVSDTGIGIAEDAMEKVFQPFQQADDTVLSRFGGTGLGLAICRQLCDQLGGSIRVESELGQGSCFIVQLPVTPIEEQSDPTDVSSDPVVKLIAIGDFDNELLARAQSAGNYFVRTLPCSEPGSLLASLAQIDLPSFDVAIIDQNLAGKISSEMGIWKLFGEHKVAPVLVSNDQSLDIDEIGIRASFASVIPAAPNFDELRSAIRIGCSFAHPLQKPESSEPKAVQVYSPKTVLVTDDNRTNRHLLSAILEAAGHHATLVCDGDEMLEILEKQIFDVVLLDVNMPRLNGIDACRMWRQIEGGRNHLPIIGVTADATSETEEKCLAAGMDMRITKPVKAKLLLDLIERYCGDKSIELPIPGPLDDPLGKVVSIASNTELSGIDAVDLEQIKYLKSIGDASFLDDMIDGFISDVSESLEALRSSVLARNPSEFRFAAHAIKSCSNNVGAALLSAMCAKLEAISEPELIDLGTQHLQKVERELERVLAELAPHRSGYGDSKAADAA